MPARFDEDGVQFLYPENWQLQREETDTGWTVSLQSPETAFLVLSFDSEMPEPEVVAHTALDAIKEEYKDVESEDKVESLAGQPAVGHDVRFFSFDLTNTVYIRSFYSGSGTVLVFWQANDLELERHEPILRAILTSLHVEED